MPQPSEHVGQEPLDAGPGARPSQLPAVLSTRTLCSTIHAATCDGRVNPSSTRRHDRLSLRHASIQSVASESRALAKVLAG